MPTRNVYPIGETVNCTREPSEDVRAKRFYPYVPKELQQNLLWRRQVMIDALASREFRAQYLRACAEDVLFWINSACWVYEPRPDDDLPDEWIPFITWTSQDNAIVLIEKYIGRREIGIEKSRAQGASWIVLMVYLHQWIFSGRTKAFGLVSRNEALVNNEDDPDSLFWKVDNQLARLPTWMVPWYKPDRDRLTSKNVLKHPITKATFVGSAATKDPFVGGRKTGILWDEFAKFPVNAQEQAMAGSQHSTRGRIILSTPMGNHDKFYEVMVEKPSTMLKLRMHWSENPMHGAGLYRVEPIPNTGRSRIIRLDKNYDYRGYRFVRHPKIGGLLRSPWYDAECTRPGAVKEAIARELDIDYGGSAYKYYGDIPAQLMERTKPPALSGVLRFDDLEQVPEFQERAQGSLKLWQKLDEDGYLPLSEYVVSCDVAAGSGSDDSNNSVMLIFDRKTRTQVGEWARHDVYPEKLAHLALATCRWLARGGRMGRVTLIWDAQAIGGVFSRVVRNAPHQPILWRKRPWDEFGRVKYAKKPGWTTQDPEELHGDFRAALGSARIIIVSRDVLAECTGWEHINGKLVYVPSLTTKIASSMGKNHGDRVSAAAMAWQALHSVAETKEEKVEQPTAPGPGYTDPDRLGHTGSLAYRLSLRDDERRDWDIDPEEDIAA